MGGIYNANGDACGPQAAICPWLPKGLIRLKPFLIYYILTKEYLKNLKPKRRIDREKKVYDMLQ